MDGFDRTTVENGCKMDVFDFGGGVVFLWWWCGGVFVRAVFVRRGVFVVVLWWCFCVWCFCGGVVVVFLCVLFVRRGVFVVALWWCSCVWCFCGGVVVSAKTAQSSAEVIAVFKGCLEFC